MAWSFSERSLWSSGGAVRLRFDHTGGGFQLADGAGVFRDAEAVVTGPDTVLVSGVPEPLAARYAWYSYGPAGLYGGTGLAAAPFEILL